MQQGFVQFATEIEVKSREYLLFSHPSIIKSMTMPGFLDKKIAIRVIRDSSAVRRLFVRLAGAVGRQSALHKENSGFAAPTLGRHISTFRGYQILFSIQNPYINRFTNHFSIHS